MTESLQTAIMIPCYNEEAAIEAVITGFRRAVPDAKIYVYDNNSKDRTKEIARDAGAIVRHEPLQGKGYVIRRMFSDIEADIYVLVDGDMTYDPTSAPVMIQKLLDNQLDMVNGARVTEEQTAYRTGHRLGNKLLTGMVSLIFGNRFKDMLSGYRVFSRRYVKSFPALSRGFETETELTIHALELRMPTDEVETIYRARPIGSCSKLNTYKDGFRILWMIFVMLKEERPMWFFMTWTIFLGSLAIGLISPIFVEYMQTGLVPRLPTAIMAMGMLLLSAFSFACGLILDTVTLGRHEMKRMRYLNIPATQR